MVVVMPIAESPTASWVPGSAEQPSISVRLFAQCRTGILAHSTLLMCYLQC